MRNSLSLARRLLISGVLIVLPLALTAWLVAAIFGLIHGTVTELVRGLFAWVGISIADAWWWDPLLLVLGVLSSVAILMGVGLLGTNLFGRRVIRFLERLLLSIPLVRVVYAGAKQLLEAITTGRQIAFREVVALEYPRRGCWALGFVTSTTRGTLWAGTGDEEEEEMVQVFIPTSPNPTSGMMLILPAASVTTVNISVEEAIKMIVSGGLVLPSALARRQRAVQDGI